MHAKRGKGIIENLRSYYIKNRLITQCEIIGFPAFAKLFET